MTPAHDAEPVGVHVGKRLEVIDGRRDVIEFLAAVVDRHVVRVAVPGAPAVVRRDDDVAALHGLLHEREHRLIPVAMHASVHPDHRGVALRPAVLHGCEEVCRDHHAVGAALVGDLLEIYDSLEPGGIDAVGLLLQHLRSPEIGFRKVFRFGADVELPCAGAVEGALEAATSTRATSASASSPLRCRRRRRRRVLRGECNRYGSERKEREDGSTGGHRPLVRWWNGAALHAAWYRHSEIARFSPFSDLVLGGSVTRITTIS